MESFWSATGSTIYTITDMIYVQWPPKVALYRREKYHELSRKIALRNEQAVETKTKHIRNTFTQALPA